MTEWIEVYDVYWYRKALGLTQRQCARACGLGLETFRRLEQGKQRASRAALRHLAKGLHVPQSLLRQKPKEEGWR